MNNYTKEALIKSFEDYGFVEIQQYAAGSYFQHKDFKDLEIKLSFLNLNYTVHYIVDKFRFYLEAEKPMDNELFHHISRLYNINKKELNYYNKISDKEVD